MCPSVRCWASASATRKALWSTAIPVLLSWVITLPCAALLGALAYQFSKLLT